MIRYSILALFIGCIVSCAWRNWYLALCLLLPVVAVLERPDMPHAILGLQGLNPFNIGLAGILVAWASGRPPRTAQSTLPFWFRLAMGLFAATMFIAFCRLFAQPGRLLSDHSTFGLVTDYFVNTFEWLLPGYLLAKGTSDRTQLRWAALSLLVLFMLLAWQVMRQVPLSYLASGTALSDRAGGVLDRRVGYHRVELAGIFAGASWALLAARSLMDGRLAKLAFALASAGALLALGLTGGRAGYGAWCIVGLLFAALRWRKALLLGPAVLGLLLIYAPGIQERFLQGIAYQEDGTRSASSEPDLYSVTSGRSILWPYVVQGIRESPIVGYGREAMNRTGLRERVLRATGEDFGHPHNGYLQFTLDNGLLGLSVALVLFVGILLTSARLFVRHEPEAIASGGMALASVMAFIVAATGAQTFYPTQLSVVLWATVGLAMRASVRMRGAVPAAVGSGVRSSGWLGLPREVSFRGLPVTAPRHFSAQPTQKRPSRRFVVKLSR